MTGKSQALRLLSLAESRPGRLERLLPPRVTRQTYLQPFGRGAAGSSAQANAC